MEKLYIVCWGIGSCNDDGNAYAYCGIHGIYRDKESALKGLINCFDDTLEDIVTDLDPDGEFPDLVDKADIRICGSEQEEFFEIDYIVGTEPHEVHIKIEEKDFN